MAGIKNFLLLFKVNFQKEIESERQMDSDYSVVPIPLHARKRPKNMQATGSSYPAPRGQYRALWEGLASR